MSDHDDHPDPALRDLIDASFGDGPPPVTPTDRLVPARRALRRRRTATVGGAVAAVAVIGLGASAVAGPGASTAVAPGSGGATPAPTSAAATPDVPVPALPMPPGVAVDSPLGQCLGAISTLAELNGASFSYDSESGTLTLTPRIADLARVELAEQGLDPSCIVTEEEMVEPGVDEGEGSSLVRFAGPRTERLEARADTVITVQTGDVDLPENFAGPDDRTAVARVETGGRSVWVLARQLPDSAPEYISEPDPEDRWTTVEAFLDHARKKYDSGEGLR